MFGFGKKKPTFEVLGMALMQVGWNAELEENERNAVRQSGVNLNIYQGEIICLSLFSAVYAFSIWSSERSLTQDQVKTVMSSFYAFVEQQCSELPMSSEMYELISNRMKQYHAAQEIDEEAAMDNALSLELPRVFVTSLAVGQSEPPMELMAGVTPRFHGVMDAAESILNDLWEKM